jgi:tricorn protease
MGREAQLVRYPDYHQGRIAFTHMADIWLVDENGRNLQRLTAHAARDINPRFSPDGKWIAFSSDRNGNLDVFVVPVQGGLPRQLTFHSADDTTLGWTPDSKAVLFSAQRNEDFLARLYTVNVETAAERNAGPDFGLAGSYSPDGKRLAFNRKGQSYWRKYYRGSYQTDVTVMDIAARKFTDLTDFNGMDSWPMWGRDGFIYFVSDRDGGGLTNIWRVSEKGGKAEKVTQFTSGDVRFPSISADGKVIVFEHDFSAWKLDVASRKASPVKVQLAAETQESLTEVRSYNSRADDFSLAPNSRRIVFSTHGEIFTAPVDEGDLRQLTDDPARDRDPLWSPDGKLVVYVSDRSGREEIWVVPAEGGEARKLTDLDTLKTSMRWSPDSKEIAFTTSDSKLMKAAAAGGAAVELASSRYGNLSSPVWSPDGKWIAFSRADQSRSTDIWVVPSTGGQERKVTFDSYSEVSPRFSADGKKLYFIRMDSVNPGLGEGQPAMQIHMVILERQERDPDDPEERGESEDAPGPAGAGARRPQPAGTVKEVAIDFDGLKRRTRQVTRMPFAVTSFEVLPDNRTLVFVTSEPGATRSTPVIYTIQDSGRRLTRVAVGGIGGGEESGGPPAPFPGFLGFGGIRDLAVARDGRNLFFREGGSVYSVSLPAAPPPGGGSGASSPGPPSFSGGAPGSGGSASRRRVNFNAKVRINKPAEWAEMFSDAWRTMKYRFYDPKMHGFDWDAMRAKYQPLVEFVGDRQELLNLINEMIGELNASHTGAAPGFGSREGAVQSSHLGVELTPDDSAGRYRVTHIYERGPADKDWVKVKVGDYLIAIDNHNVTANDNYWRWLNNNRLNRKVTVTFNSKPSEEGAWKTRIEPVSMNAFSDLRYERWVKQRKDMAEKLGGGKVGYLHIRAMDQTSLRRFEKELRENRDKPALVIDQRWNGGGNIEQQLLAILVQREYQIWKPRGTEETGRPFAGYFGKKIVLQNWRSASNAEMFPAGFRALGLGRTLGTPTVGAVIGTGSYSLIDGSTVRTPGVGVFLADGKKTNMENYGVPPDILVENTPEDNLVGRDRQLEAAVSELLKDLK